MDHVPQSPYLRALGQQRTLLHPALRAYFSAVPRGQVGIGEGVFHRIGTPRRWLWPILRLFQNRGVVHAGWHEDVPFTVRNRTIASTAIGVRTLHLPDGDWTMKDAVSAHPRGTVVDQLGEPTTLAVSFEVFVDGDALALRSKAVGIRWGWLRIRLPRLIAPVVRLRESAEKQSGRQRVVLTVDMPLIGRLYEYDGTFEYRVQAGV
ncbi:hypothetical protein FM104_09005 [Microbacterium esteraromaticum]|uniref:DUF4166 domain-containing protein n=1 Tax=Microbacterium esteraromaticum TaxID=57043 RepID=A0A1R4JUP1_9MICO|nr:DUF4166 domain-containing protein [Microbacterium esteraromaticum]SJN35689.1 hypothetical protein FM104_09005 [Microbacterium esteraromaticum]